MLYREQWVCVLDKQCVHVTRCVFASDLGAGNEEQVGALATSLVFLYRELEGTVAVRMGNVIAVGLIIEGSEDPVGWAKRAFGFERFRQRVLVRPQSELLTNDNGELALSFIGRYEQLDNDLNLICRELGAPFAQLNHRNVTSNKKPEIYRDIDFLREVETFYSDDFNLLGYDRS